MSSKKQPKPDQPRYPRVIETFTDPDYKIGQLHGEEPYCFNGIVGVRKYRVTVELVDEPMEVIHARIRHLWRNCDNHHHSHPLRRKAEEYGLKLDSSEYAVDRLKSSGTEKGPLWPTD